MVESNGEGVQVPWFSGLCLEGEVAGQYEMEGSGSQQEGQEATKAGLLELDGLAPITIFVGANNSGKSRLMRELFKTPRTLRLKLKSRDSEGIEVDIRSEISSLITTMGAQDNALSNGWIVEQERSLLGGYIGTLDNVTAEANIDDCEILLTLKQRFLSFGVKAEIRCLHAAKRCYVPILRGLRPPFFQFKKGDEDDDRYANLYESRTARDYFQGESWTLSRLRSGPRNLIFTGLSLYDDLRSRLLGRTQAERDSVRVYENFFSENFFPGQSVILIPVLEGNSDVVHIKIGNDKEYPIYDLGDGMQSLIICTYPIVTETEPGSLFFLEEPDLCMHPSLQRTFLEVLKTHHRKMGHQFFITTHSNHLLDLLEDNELVSIFSFSEIADRAPAPTDQSQADSGFNPQQSEPKPSFRIRPSNLRERQILLDLGVRPSATFLANATIWVEGVSDCAYLRAYMEAFIYYLKVQGKDWDKRLAQRLEQYKEDRHYAFVEYNGSNLEHFSFESNESDDGQAETKSGREISVLDLCATAIVIADGDVREKGDRSTWLEDQLKKRFVCLPGKEIENLIPEALMKRQISYDHKKPRRGEVAQEVIETIAYACYARSLKGVGAYLGEDKNIPKYLNKSGKTSDPGTLPTRYKTRWRSELEGIPSLLREAINPPIQREQA